MSVGNVSAVTKAGTAGNDAAAGGGGLDLGDGGMSGSTTGSCMTTANNAATACSYYSGCSAKLESSCNATAGNRWQSTDACKSMSGVVGTCAGTKLGCSYKHYLVLPQGMQRAQYVDMIKAACETAEGTFTAL